MNISDNMPLAITSSRLTTQSRENKKGTMNPIKIFQLYTSVAKEIKN